MGVSYNRGGVSRSVSARKGRNFQLETDEPKKKNRCTLN